MSDEKETTKPTKAEVTAMVQTERTERAQRAAQRIETILREEDCSLASSLFMDEKNYRFNVAIRCNEEPK